MTKQNSTTPRPSAAYTERPNHTGAVICFCNSNRVWGGGENWHLQAARYFAEQGHKVFIAAGASGALGMAAAKMLGSNPALAGNLHLHDWSFGNLDFLNPLKTSQFASWLRDAGVTHLIMGLPADLKGGVRAARKLRGAVRLFYRRGSALPVKPSLSNKYFYGALDGLIVNSEETGRCVLNSAGLIKPEKVHVIYNSLDIAGFDAKLRAYGAGGAGPEQALRAVPQLEQSHAAGAGLGQTGQAGAGNALVIGNAGRLNVQKGQKYLLHMSAGLKKLGVKHRLLIAGSGELLGELEELAASLGLDYGCGLDCGAQVCFAGFLDDMSPFWRGIDVFVLSSLWEGFGYVLAEAMLAEKPVFAFNRNSMPELVKDGLNGFLINPPLPEENLDAVGTRMAQAVLAAAADPENLRQLGRNGRRFCETNFAQPVLMERLAQVLFKQQA